MTIGICEEKKAEAQGKSDRAWKELNKVINSNPIAKQRLELEAKQDSMKSWGKGLTFGPIILDIVLFILMITTDSIIERIVGTDITKIEIIILCIPPVFIIPGIALWIASATFNGKINALSNQLVEFDRQKAPIEAEWSQHLAKVHEYENTISQKKEDLEKYKIEEKYAPFARNHVMIFVAEEGSSSDKFRTIKHEIIIDGIEYGTAAWPFKAIELTPGLHAVQVRVGLYIGDEFCVYSADVTQVRVENGSLFLKYVFKGPARPFNAKK